MTAKERVIEAMAMAYERHDMLAGAGPIITDPEVRIQHYKNRAWSALGAALGITDDLLAALAETGVLEEHEPELNDHRVLKDKWHIVALPGRLRVFTSAVSPWVPSGDQT